MLGWLRGVGEAAMSPLALLPTAPPGNQQPLSRAKCVDCRDERELISCLGVSLGRGEMAVLGEQERWAPRSHFYVTFLARLLIFRKSCHLLMMGIGDVSGRPSGSKFT